LLEQRRPLLDKAVAAEDAYVRKLGELNGAAQQLIQTVEDFDAFLAEHLLWVRSDLPLGIQTLTVLPANLAWLLSPERWGEVLLVLGYALTHSPVSWLGLLVVAGLFVRGSRIKRALLASAEPLRRVRTDGFRHTLNAFGLTLLAALPLPLLLLLLGRELANSIEATAFTRALGRGLIQVSAGLYFLRVFRFLCISGGVADRHFRWSSGVLTVIRRNLRWFTGFIIPVGLVTSTMYYLNDPSQPNGLGRLALIAAMIAVAVFFGRLLDPRQGVLKGVLAEHPEGWPNRLRNLWFPAIVGAPIALAVLTLLGYLYTAGTLFQALVETAWMALALVVLQQTILRWLILTRRRLALQAALDRQAARRAQAQADKSDTPPKESPLPVGVEEPEVDLASLDEHTRKLVNALIAFASVLGAWWIWSDMLPAFRLLEQIPLWHYTGVVEGTEQLIPVSAADIGLVLVIIFIAVVAAKNLPALIEIVLLQATSATAGTRYAAKTLVSYGITAAAFLMAFGTLGLSWSQVQWLVAALGVGIGFGLQEIVANFISGLIILFERPVRVGDIVTIGDTTGVVTNIQIRATTVRNWDRQELVVPNKEFITGRLLNWTLTDQINRIVVNVGIEYGSNTDLALKLLAEVADENPRVLKEPPPIISFEGFGDNALMVVLRCYLESLEYRLSVTSELHRAIDKAFAAHGIAIAFPQRDIHLTAREPIDIRVQRQPRGPRSAADPGTPPAADRR
jgi:potassium efflux system protein